MVVPCFNEANRIDIHYWRSIVSQIDNCKWIFVDDGSSDGTHRILEQIGSENVHILNLPSNLGKGEAIRAGLKFVFNNQSYSSETKIVGYLDSDGAFDQIDLEKIIYESRERLSQDSRFRVLIGSRVKLAGRQISRDRTRHYLGRIISTWISLGWITAPYDTQVGLKLFTFDSNFCKAIETPFATSWFFDIELILRLEELGSGNIWEEPLSSWKEIGGSSLNFKKSLNVLWQIRKVKGFVKASNRNGKR